MRFRQVSKIAYYTGFTFLVASLLAGSFPEFWQSWLTAVFLLPSLIVLQYGLQSAKAVTPLFRMVVRIFFWAVLALHMSYLAILFSYWYFLELHPDQFDMILVNPVFIWVTLGFFAGLERFLFRSNPPEQARTISIFSDRKKTVLEVDKIAYVESRGDFTLVFLRDGSEFRNKVKISYWEQHLEQFLRIHRSFLVNPEWSVLHGATVTVNAKWELPVSRGYKKSVTEHFAQQA